VRDSKLHRIVLQKLGHVSKVLDVGCGEGKLVIFLAKRGKKRVIGLDISESGFNKAEKKATKDGVSHLIACMKCDAHQIGECFGGEKFEAVTMTYTLHHLKEPTVALREIRKVMSPKGRILIVDYVLDGVKDKGECRKFTIRDIKKMLKETGCELLTAAELELGLAFFEAEGLAEPKVMGT